MVVRSGKLVRPTVLKKRQPHAVVRGAFLSQAGHPFEQVFVKLLKQAQTSVEMVCAWLGRELDLPIPEPLFVTVERAKLPSQCPWIYDLETASCFATVAIAQARPIVRIEGTPVAERLASWKGIVTAMVFDHLIANDDRSEENLLIDGEGNFWLIDHDRALGGVGGRLFSGAFPIFTNMFLENLRRLPTKNRLDFRGQILESCARASVAVEKIPFRELRVPEDLEQQIRQFLRARARILSQVLSAELGFPELFRGSADGADAGDIVH